MIHRAHAQKGAVLAELGIFMPLLLIVMLATVDLGRLVYTNQTLADLSREAAMLVSRGGSSSAAFQATFMADDPFDLESDGGIIISRVRRRSTDDAQPWVFSQDRAGSFTAQSSHVGEPGGPADIPEITTLAPGVSITTVEVVLPFEPVFGLEGLGLDFYPAVVYDAAYF
jgi:hypothetical protein